MWVRVRHQTVTFHTARHIKWPHMTRYRLQVQHIICQKLLLELHSLEIHSLSVKILHQSSYCSIRSQQFWHLDFDQVAEFLHRGCQIAMEAQEIAERKIEAQLTAGKITRKTKKVLLNIWLVSLEHSVLSTKCNFCIKDSKKSPPAI